MNVLCGLGRVDNFVYTTGRVGSPTQRVGSGRVQKRVTRGKLWSIIPKAMGDEITAEASQAPVNVTSTRRELVPPSSSGELKNSS